MHEIALYDISTTINYILKATNQPNIIYVGHSMGTTMSLILLSTKPEFNKKIRLVVNMASVGNWKNTRNFMRFAFNNAVYITVRITFGPKQIAIFYRILTIFSIVKSSKFRT